MTDDVTLIFVCLRDDLILAFLCYSNLRRETDGFELASTITLALQANRLTKCASHPEHEQDDTERYFFSLKVQMVLAKMNSYFNLFKASFV